MELLLSKRYNESLLEFEKCLITASGSWEISTIHCNTALVLYGKYHVICLRMYLCYILISIL